MSLTVVQTLCVKHGSLLWLRNRQRWVEISRWLHKMLNATMSQVSAIIWGVNLSDKRAMASAIIIVFYQTPTI